MPAAAERVVLTVLAALIAVSTLTSVMSRPSPTGGINVSTVLSIISLGLVVAAVVFMFRPAANPYFSRSRT